MLALVRTMAGTDGTLAGGGVRGGVLEVEDYAVCFLFPSGEGAGTCLINTMVSMIQAITG